MAEKFHRSPEGMGDMTEADALLPNSKGIAEQMDDDDLAAVIRHQEHNAQNWLNSEVIKDRARALDYYLGKPFGNEVEGRSQVVSTDVFDTVEGMLPSLVEIFTSSNQIAECEPYGMEDIPEARQQTAVANHILFKQNNASLIFYTWFKDALLQKNGVVKYYYDDQKNEFRTEQYRGLSEMELMKLAQEEHVEIQSAEQYQLMIGMQPMVVFDVTAKVYTKRGRIKIVNIAPENFLVSPRQVSVDMSECEFCEHREKKTKTDLLEMGFTEDELNDLGTEDIGMDATEEALARKTDYSIGEDRPDDPMKQFECADIYIVVDYDGDGVAELRHVFKAGGKILTNEPTDHVPFAVVCPILLPHQYYGLSIADITRDVQLNKSVIHRQQLDSLYLSNNPRVTVVEGLVNIEDVITSRPGGVIRTKAPNAVTPWLMPFIGKEAFPMLEYWESVKENRTGVTRYNQGLDADSLNKMLDLETPVPMSDGTYKALRDVKDGDRIIGSRGLAVTVKHAHPVDMPKRAYRVRFKSGDEIIAGGEHLWQVQSPNDIRYGKSQILNTDALAEQGAMKNGKVQWYVPRAVRPEFTKNELPIDPYVLGVWLGDGHSYSARFTCGDAEIAARVREWCIAMGGDLHKCDHQNSGNATDYRIEAHGFTDALRSFGLLKRENADPHGKYIPDVYLRSSYEDRLQLLRGLMDTDGCHHSGALSVFSQKKGRLSESVILLLESLGAWPSFSEVDPGPLARDGETYLNITFHLPDNPFSLSRKADKFSPPERCVERQPILEITPVDIRPMRCLTVDANDGLYCVGRRFTVTHNTAHGISQIMTAAMKRQELIARLFAETGVKYLVRGILHCIAKSGMKSLTVRLTNNYVPIDPRQWRNQYDVTINVALGSGTKERQIQMLNMLSAKQVELMQTGRGYMVSDANQYNLAAKLAEAAGIKTPELLFTDPQTVPPQAKQAPPPIEVLKLQQDKELKVLDMQVTAQQTDKKMMNERTIEAMKAKTDQETKLAVAQLSKSAQENVAGISAETTKRTTMANAMLEDHKLRGAAEMEMFHAAEERQKPQDAVAAATQTMEQYMQQLIQAVVAGNQQNQAGFQAVANEVAGLKQMMLAPRKRVKDKSGKTIGMEVQGFGTVQVQ